MERESEALKDFATLLWSFLSTELSSFSIQDISSPQVNPLCHVIFALASLKHQKLLFHALSFGTFQETFGVKFLCLVVATLRISVDQHLSANTDLVAQDFFSAYQQLLLVFGQGSEMTEEAVFAQHLKVYRSPLLKL